MKESLEELKKLILDQEINVNKVKELHINFVKNELKNQHCVDNYIGDFPTFIEPVFLGENVKIGDDVLIGPNVYIGNNCKIGDYVELVNTIIYDSVEIGENFTLDNCIIAPQSKLKFNNLKAVSSIFKGEADSEQSTEIISF